MLYLHMLFHFNVWQNSLQIKKKITHVYTFYILTPILMLIENIYLTKAVIYFYMFSIFYFLQTSLFILLIKSKCLSTYSWVVSFGYFKSRISFRAIRLCLTVSFKWAGEENHRLITVDTASGRDCICDLLHVLNDE